MTPETPAGAGREEGSAAPAGASGEGFRRKVRAAQSAHNAARRRGRFTRAAKKTGPGMIRRPPPPPDPPDGTNEAAQAPALSSKGSLMARIRSVKPEFAKPTPYEAMWREPTAEEAAEFRGLFFGEGHIDLARPAHGTSLTPRLRIAVRDDDVAIAEWCRSLFGGNLSRRAATRSVCWQLTGKASVSRALAVLDAGCIPSKKRREVQLLIEAVALIGAPSVPAAPAAARRVHEIREELKTVRAYPEQVA